MEKLSKPAYPPRYSYPVTGAFFVLGGLVTAIFSGSLAVLATKAELAEVLTIGMLVPSFTWLVQLSASGLGHDLQSRRFYWGDLGRICLLGSVALLPAAMVNLFARQPPLWLSAGNVLVSVVIMAADLFRRSARHGVEWGWPASWCLTITLNMALFVWASWSWWGRL